jgi:hypothetical protein
MAFLPEEQVGGLQLNIAAVAGPTLGGLLLPLIGAKWIFCLNSICFLIVALAVIRWKPTRPCTVAFENFLESFLTAIRYVRHSPGVQSSWSGTRCWPSLLL